MTGLTEAKGASLALDDTLLSTANAKGASLVSIEDAAANFTGTTVEAALAELISSHFLTSVLAKVASYTVLAADENKHITFTGTSTATLPAAGSVGSGFAVLINNIGVAVVTLDPDGVETVNGAATLDLAAGDFAILTCTGTAWAAAHSVTPLAAASLTNYVQKPIDRFLQYDGDDSDGAFSSSGASTLSDFLYDHTTFALNAGHTITIDVPVCIIRASTSIVIDGDINGTGTLIAAGAGAAMGRLGDSLGSSGGGGGGGGAGYDGADISYPGLVGEDGGSTYFQAGGAGGLGGESTTAATPDGADGAVGVVVAANQKTLISTLFSTLIARGGGAGGAGGLGASSLAVGDEPGAPGVGGLAGTLLILIAPSITIDAASTLDFTGQAGTAAGNSDANSGGSGGGGGGAGGTLIKVSPSITDGGTTTVAAGAGGAGDAAAAPGDGGDGAAGAAGYSYEIDPTI